MKKAIDPHRRATWRELPPDVVAWVYGVPILVALALMAWILYLVLS